MSLSSLRGPTSGTQAHDKLAEQKMANTKHSIPATNYIRKVLQSSVFWFTFFILQVAYDFNILVIIPQLELTNEAVCI